MRNNLLATEGGYDGDLSGGSGGLSHASDDAGVKKYFSTAPAPISRRTLSLLVIALSLLSIVLLALAITVAKDEEPASKSPTPSPPSYSSAPAPTAYSGFASIIGTGELWRHLNALQAIADANNGTRAIGSPGFNASVDYIYNVLSTQTHFDVMQQTFPDTAWLLSEPHVAWGPPSARLPQLYQTAYHVMTYSGSAHVRNASLVNVDTGCSDANYAAFPRGAVAIALMATQCSNAARATRAAYFGAVAILQYQLRTTRTFLSGGVTANTPGATIGSFSLPFTTGVALAELVDARGPGGVTVDLNLTTTTGRTYVTNTCATSKYGSPNRTIVSGSHCDSVPAGAGVNDNGSGTSLNLALALALNQWEETPGFVPFRNRVRFCWWAAEEVGLHGSQEYVRLARLEGLKGENGKVGERIPQDIQANLNYVRAHEHRSTALRTLRLLWQLTHPPVCCALCRTSWVRPTLYSACGTVRPSLAATPTRPAPSTAPSPSPPTTSATSTAPA